MMNKTNKIDKDHSIPIRRKILVVDDNEFIRESFHKILTPEGYNVIKAMGGISALEKIKKHDFDVVFTELKLLDINGMQLLREAKAIKPNTDFIIITEIPTVESAVEAMKFGAQDYLEKPFAPIELKQFTNKVIRKREEREGFVRFTLSQRIQHIILMVSFLALAITGLPLVFPNAPIIRSITFFSDTSMLRGLIHRIAAITLLSLSIYHIGYSMFSEKGNQDLKKIIPRIKDVKDAWLMLKHHFRLSNEYPKFDKFNFIEKFEYFGVVWGTLIMAITGLILWFEEAIFPFFPLWVIDLVRTIHRYEAILAISTIVIWHMYNVHFNAEVFPMNKVWLTGKLNREEMIKHHPLEYFRLADRKIEEERNGDNQIEKLKRVSN